MSSSEKITVDDCIVLGNAVPDELSDNRFAVCTAGYSPQNGLVRIYPVPPRSNMKRWNIVKVPLERNPKDTRSESWKIQGSKSDWLKLADKIEPKGKLKREEQIDLLKKLFKDYGVDCVSELNERKASLGLVRPKTFKPRFEKREDHDPSSQLGLFSTEPFLTIKNYKIQPRISYTCSGCKTTNQLHDQQVLEWGVYEWIRQNEEHPEKVWENLHITDPEYDKRFLVGNQFLYRNSFMIISIFRHKVL